MTKAASIRWELSLQISLKLIETTSTTLFT